MTPVVHYLQLLHLVIAALSLAGLKALVCPKSPNMCSSKPGVCWFTGSVALNALGLLLCFGIYTSFGGPPPHPVVEVGIRIFIIGCTTSVIVSLFCILSLYCHARSLSLVLFCEFGLLIAIACSGYVRYSLYGIELNPTCMANYTKQYYKMYGSPPPFVDYVQEKFECCGIFGILDYSFGKGVQEIEAPSSCCAPRESWMENCTFDLRSQYKSVNRGKRNKIGSPDIHLDGCLKYLMSATTVINSLPADYRAGYVVAYHLRNGYLTVLAILNIFLLFLFNFFVIRYRCKFRQAVAPRANQPTDAIQPMPPCPPISINISPGTGPGGRHLEYSPPTYLLPPMTPHHPLTTAYLTENGTLRDGPCDKCARFSAQDRNANTYTPSAPPAFALS